VGGVRTVRGHHREGPARYATSPQPVSEVPSTVHQLLHADHLVDEGGALAEAGMFAIRDERTEVRMEDFVEAWEKIQAEEDVSRTFA